ncbi:hypothetical protein HZS61_008445 [Fusarium oxysporum f. sp. conglutinans]|uniref:Chromo domain-containing protein n=1 Tax=Fusarium oxysporum f. sp. conglutinans TaxID=100902 RepID=A0A8H6H110_FUSOX|nr:hypothetical protein HZS61_008445 [Fusarium oxysporum f. sp. conglutinans]
MAAATRSKHHGAAHIQEPVASKGSPIAGKVQSPPKGGATQKIDPGFEKDVAIDEFIDHRVDTKNSTVDIQVKWQDGETTWESEWSLQEKVPSLVFKYWEKLDGRDAATNLDTYSGMQKVFAAGCAAYHALLAATYRPYMACGESYLGGDGDGGPGKGDDL